ncbi:ATP-binding protein [Virgibacillus siamensis]|uniref:ATP-binding protein n=1 Tax=Virgibacillus siamensis TaxID=480071 RepID=UPI00158C6901|nr:AAA family ATPase [Virgibacillus siamensis]
MEIKHAHIYGFGKWTDVTIDLSTAPFICLYGNNESGKSTIQQFLMFMLFGFPPKKRAFYRPKKSGKTGGRLTLYDEDAGEFTIERIDGVRNGAALCYSPDGQSFDEKWLQERLFGMTHAAYQRVFTFSAMDLTALQDMKEEDVGEILLGIGLTASANLHAIERALDSKIDALFKPSGRKPEINRQLQVLDDLDRSLKTYANSEETYREKQAAVNQLTEEIEKLQYSVQQDKRRLTRIERQKQALPIVQEYRETRNHLTQLPESIPFPENGSERLKDLNSELLPLKSELSVLQVNEKKYKEKLNSIRTGFYEKHIYLEADKLLKKEQLFLEINQSMKASHDSISKLESQLDIELEQLQIGIGQSDLAGLTLPFHLEKSWSQLKDNKKQLDNETEQLYESNKQMKANRNHLKEQESELTKNLLPGSKQTELENKLNAYKERQLMEKMKQDAVQQQNSWKKMKENQEKQARLWLSGSIAAAIIFVLVGALAGETMFYLIGAVIALPGILQWWLGNKSNVELESTVPNNEVPSVQVSDMEKEEAARVLSNQEQLRKELTNVQDKLRDLDITLLQWNEKKHGLERRRERMEEQIAMQQEDYPFLRQVDPDFWPELYTKLKTVLNIYRDLKLSEQQYTKLSKEIQHLDDQLNGFYQTTNWVSAKKSLETKFHEMEQVLEDYKDKCTLAAQYEKWIKDNREQQQQMTQKMRVYHSSIEELFSIAGAVDEEDFLKKSKLLEGKQQNEEKIRQQMRQLHAFMGQAERKSLLEGNVQHEDLEREYESTASNIASIEEVIHKKRQKQAEIHAELSGMESSESQSDLQHRFSMESEQLKKLAHEWSVYKTAKEMLAESKRNYRNKYLDEVMERTETYFGKITNHYYHAVYLPSSATPFQVEAKDGIRYTARELSKGTIDQLYVSLRLAIGEVMSEKHKLPFIIDDAFVHFDAVRTKQLMDILTEISDSRQIILFTCNRDISEAAQEINVMELNNSVRIN